MNYKMVSFRSYFELATCTVSSNINFDRISSLYFQSNNSFLYFQTEAIFEQIIYLYSAVIWIIGKIKIAEGRRWKQKISDKVSYIYS